VWTYILRRLLLMIPTLFGVTVISFLVIQLSPGDPIRNQLGVGGMASQSGQTRDAYLVQKRDLHLDKPKVLNFSYFSDFTESVHLAAFFLSRQPPELAEQFGQWAKAYDIKPPEKPKDDQAAEEDPANEKAKPAERWSDVLVRIDDPAVSARLVFLHDLDIETLQQWLADPAAHVRLATAVGPLVQTHCEDLGIHGVLPAMEMLRREESDGKEKIGAIRSLRSMVIDPLVFSYPREASDRQTDEIVAVWRRWWELARAADQRRAAEEEPAEFPLLEPARRKALEQRFAQIMAAESRKEQFDLLEFYDLDRYIPYRRADMRFFVEILLGESSLEEKMVAAEALGGYIGTPLRMDVPLDADEEQIAEVAANWELHLKFHGDRYEHGVAAKLWYIVGDTQYAHIASRLLTFNFGRSATRTREPVGRKIWNAVIVSAPLMIMAQLVIYFIAVPLGIICAVNRGKATDRFISLGLFLLYSIPPFVASMIFLMLFCYGDFVRWFPMDGLHSDWAHEFGFFRYMLDYFHHAFLPVVCLSLFSLAGLAMYARSSMLDVLGQDYMRTAHAKGLSRGRVIFKHGLRNSLIPIVTLFASFLPAMLGGSVIIEVIFGIPGMGRLGWESIEAKDYPTLMALIYVDAIVVMLSILMTDILYVFIDPRISFERQGGSA